jgi:DNA-binding NtrC family response regulator
MTPSKAEPSELLVVDDDPSVGRVLVALLRQAGYEASHAPGAQAALAELTRRPYDLVVTDLRMPGTDGLALLEVVKREHPEVPVIMLTAYGNVPTAVQAMRAGADDFLLKPFDRDEVLATIARVLQMSAQRRAAPPTFELADVRLVGASAAHQALLERVQRAARSTANVWLFGEAGAGKERVARAIHAGSDRRDGPFVQLELSTLPSELWEGALFGGPARGPSGSAARPGALSLARSGTLLLHDVDLLPAPIQARLATALASRDPRAGTGDVRVMSATRADLAQRVRAGEFRDDLYYGLAVVPITLVPLRERREDVLCLVEHFLDAFAQAHGVARPTLLSTAQRALEAHPWPGNVRELANVVERLVVLSPGEQLGAGAVDRELGGAKTDDGAPPAPGELSLQGQVQASERAAIQHALARARGNRSVAARLLGISRRTLYNKLAELGMV